MNNNAYKDKSHLKLVYSAEENCNNNKINTSNVVSQIYQDRNQRERGDYKLGDSGDTDNLIFFASGKGGVGKTWLTVNLAQMLASWGKKVLVFDADLRFANVDVQLGLLPDSDLTQVALGNIPFRNAITRYNLGDFDVLAGSTMPGSFEYIDSFNMEKIWKDLSDISNEYDIVLVDLGNMNDVNAGIFNIAKKGIMLTTDEPSSLSDVYTMMKFIHDKHKDISLDVVVNKVDNYTTGSIAFNALENVTKGFLNFEPNLLGIIRHDDMVNESIRNQVTTLTYSPQSKSVNDLRLIVPEIIRICSEQDYKIN